MRKNTSIHYFFYIILFAIISLTVTTTVLSIRYGNIPATLSVIVFNVIMIIVLVLIFLSYLRNKPLAEQVFEFIPCRFGIVRGRFVDYCRRCTTVYPSLVIIGIFAALSASKWEQRIDQLISILGINTTLIIGIICILLIPIQASISMIFNKESNKLRTVTGVLFSVGVLFVYFYILKTL